MAYLIDANVFIQAKNGHYGFNLCPGFWNWIDRAHANNEILSVAKIYDELVDGGDHLSKWVKTRRSFFKLPNDQNTEKCLSQLSEWAANNYDSSDLSTFFSSGDYFLIGYAMANNHTVVTHESKKGRIKIPVVCNNFGVNCMNPFEMLEKCNVKFMLAEGV